MWTKKDMPDMMGKIAVVTGANSGIGFETALGLFEAGATVIVASRDIEKATEAISKMQRIGGKGILKPTVLELSDLSSIRDFASDIIKNNNRLDLLINNAGIMMPPAKLLSSGVESQFGVNYLGHFLLTSLLYPLLKNTADSRIITLTSLAYVNGAVDFDNLKLEKEYDPSREYAQSKLANLLFSIELQRKINQQGDSVLSLASHPGVTSTNLSRHFSKEAFDEAISHFGELMPASQGALPTLYAATFSKVKEGGLYGPDSENNLKGYPAFTPTNEMANDASLAAKLWKKTEEILEIDFL